jgi:hypothetical protein
LFYLLTVRVSPVTQQSIDQPPSKKPLGRSCLHLSVDQASVLPEPVGVLAVLDLTTHETLRAYIARVSLAISAAPGCATRFRKDRRGIDETVPGHCRAGGTPSDQTFNALCLGRAGRNSVSEARTAFAVRSRRDRGVGSKSTGRMPLQSQLRAGTSTAPTTSMPSLPRQSARSILCATGDQTKTGSHERGTPMALYRRGPVWWIRLSYQG